MLVSNKLGTIVDSQYHRGKTSTVESARKTSLVISAVKIPAEL